MVEGQRMLDTPHLSVKRTTITVNGEPFAGNVQTGNVATS